MAKLYAIENKLVKIGNNYLGELPVYDVHTYDNGHGSVTASPSSGRNGTVVTLSNSPDTGYKFDAYTVEGATVSGDTLTIAGSDVSVTGTFIEDVIDYNPLNLPARTIRIEFDNNRSNNIWRSGYSKPSSVTMTNVSGRIYDFTYNNANWSSLFQGSDYCTRFDNRYRILGANLSTVTNLSQFLGAGYGTWSGDTASNTAYCYEIVNPFDTSNATDVSYMLQACKAGDFGGTIETVPALPFDSAQNVEGLLYGVSNLKYGIYDLYQKLSTNGHVTNHSGTFYNAGSNTTEGAAELAQIPSDWKTSPY